MLAAVLPSTARLFARAIVMPNLRPPVTTAAAAVAYRERILAALPPGLSFTPLMTAYLTDSTDPQDLKQGFEAGVFTAVKLYPANATTNSAAGVTDLEAITPVLEMLQAIDRPLLIHGEVTDAEGMQQWIVQSDAHRPLNLVIANAGVALGSSRVGGLHRAAVDSFDVNVGGFEAGHPKSYFSPYRNPQLADGPDGADRG